jgi:hypothetical protein
MNYETSKAECKYIASIDPHHPGGAFNNDPKCFANYVNMQANDAANSGWRINAMDMLQARDIAQPMFRSMHPENETLGAFSVPTNIYVEMREDMRANINLFSKRG